MKLTFIALFVAATVNGQDYYDNVDKRGGDARFATGVMGAGFNRISKKTIKFCRIVPESRTRVRWTLIDIWPEILSPDTKILGSGYTCTIKYL